MKEYKERDINLLGGYMKQLNSFREANEYGTTFAESEVRHQDAYSHLLEILGLNNEFKHIKKKPVIMRRVHYLEMALKNSKSEDNKEYAESVLLFSLFIEHVSLFSQFLIIMAFNKHKNKLKGISNVVEVCQHRRLCSRCIDRQCLKR